jgi:uncharacterized membrane protein
MQTIRIAPARHSVRSTESPYLPFGECVSVALNYHLSMPFLLRAIRLLTLVVWVGGLIFFAFVEAQVAFHIMGTAPPFGALIAGSIGALNQMGQTCGGLFLLATLVLASRAGTTNRKLLLAQVLLVFLMMAATAVVQLHIVPAMERDRIAAGGEIDAAPPDNPARVDFDRLHALSEKTEGAALLLGLAVVVLVAAEPSGSQPDRLTH